jgi:hypothetical protein
MPWRLPALALEAGDDLLGKCREVAGSEFLLAGFQSVNEGVRFVAKRHITGGGEHA